MPVWVLPPLIIVVGVVVLLFSAYHGIEEIKGQRRVGRIALTDVGRSLGGLLCGLGILSILIYIPMVTDFFAEIRTKIGASTLQSIMPAPIATQVENYIVRDPFYRDELEVEYFLSPDSANPTECLAGKEILKTTVHNTNPLKAENYPLKVYITDLSQKCKGTRTNRIKVYDKQDGTLLYSLGPEVFDTVEQHADQYSFETHYAIPPGGQIFVVFEHDVLVERAKDRLGTRVTHPTKALTISARFPPGFRVSSRFSHPARNDSTICMAYHEGPKYWVKIKCGLLPFQSAEIYWPPP